MGKICLLCSEINPYPMQKLCAECFYKTHKDYKPRKAIRKVSLKKQARINNGESEKPLFLEIWNERKHECVTCGKYLPDLKVWNCSHIHSKGSRPDLKMDKDNIILECFACHFQRDHGLTYKGPNLDI